MPIRKAPKQQSENVESKEATTILGQAEARINPLAKEPKGFFS